MVSGAFALAAAVIPVWLAQPVDTGTGHSGVNTSSDDRLERIDCSRVHKRVYEFARRNAAFVSAELQADTTGDTFLTREEREACPTSIRPILDMAQQNAVKNP
jgi:hypothetical protein